MSALARDPEAHRLVAAIQAEPALDREQELALARAYRDQGDAAAGLRVVQANLRHVLPVAFRFRRYGVPLGDLIAQGSVALHIALARFEPERGLRFATYASHWVHSELFGLVQRERSVVGGSRGALRSRLAVRLRREHRALCARLGEGDAVYAALAARHDKSADAVRDLLAVADARDASLDARAPAYEHGSYAAWLIDEGPLEDEQLDAHRSELRAVRAVRAATTDLNERERFLLEHRLMADDDARLTLGEIGKRFGVSRERARQLEANVKAKLRARLSGLAAEMQAPAAA